jgi:hypothetical protein
MTGRDHPDKRAEDAAMINAASGRPVLERSRRWIV